MTLKQYRRVCGNGATPRQKFLARQQVYARLRLRFGLAAVIRHQRLINAVLDKAAA